MSIQRKPMPGRPRERSSEEKLLELIGDLSRLYLKMGPERNRLIWHFRMATIKREVERRGKYE